ncbi:MAG: tungstate ABC transporter substrate-binding protein WtpA [Sulfurospirillum sp.]|uniref:Extracellular solute-binding protein family 1 n=1 Tax=Sulfurospirillum deleyianum (strain ATCC 51133 / DSM 6946 / 5175) TaxID=525898 RepID=D1B4Q0_SULD5|nr:tungstate ABC transporter substrate-binding protein WtpA [Sulfurospirillum deleyianum]ACZ13070.1 extracellular solute-binding protein family 1 [Sulfurospirillum deleyianum DSM 6946]MBP9566882.1 tungstate ABC transporter substrate-binding protein WtpA [Sulfurospirillum sp.]
MNKILVLSALAASLLLAKEPVVVLHAGSLSVPFAEIEKVFETKYPQFDVQREPSGSVAAARKVTDLGRAADVMGSADYQVIDTMLIPNHAKFNAHFATNEMVLAYTEKSKFAKEINSNNWADIFLREGVTVGHSNPNLDPCGYRSMLVTMLAEKHYKKEGLYAKIFGYGDHYEIGEENAKKVIVRPKETDLLGLLESHQYDYLYIYKSVADQHKLKYVSLPEEINLKNAKFEDFYKSVSFNIDGKKPGEVVKQVGAPMVYGLSVFQNDKSPANKAGAVAFVNFVLSAEGQAIMKKNGQDAMNPPVITGDSSILGSK